MDEPRQLSALDDDELLDALGAALAVDRDVVVPLDAPAARRPRRWPALAAAAAVVAAAAVGAATLDDDGATDVAVSPDPTTTATSVPVPTALAVADARLDELAEALFGGGDDAAVADAASAARDALDDLTTAERAALGPRVDDLLRAADERTAPVTPTTTATTSAPPATPTTGADVDDVSGNCDEPEHAADPECTGAGADDDDSGSGSSSGSGSGSDGDSSGPGSGRDDDP